MPESLSLIDLTDSDIAQLPSRLRERIRRSSSSTESSFSAWLLVGEATEGLARLIERAVETLPPIAAERRTQLTESNIEKILDVILADAPRPRIDIELDIDNARLRSQYLRETHLLTAKEVRDASGLRPRNKSEPASRWKREGKLFAVRRSGIDFYPAFQFVDGVPRPAIKDILANFPKGTTGWQTAMWFASANGWLDGAAPQECLSDPHSVVHAALKLAYPAVG